MNFHALSSFPGNLTKIHAGRTLGGMASHDYPQRFADALVSEIKAEMGRQGLSSRAVGRVIGKTSQYMSDRLDGGSPKTGKRTVLNAKDLAAIASALGLSEVELVTRAQAVARRSHLSPTNVSGPREDHLQTVELDAYALAATDDDTPIDPSRGEA